MRMKATVSTIIYLILSAGCIGAGISDAGRRCDGQDMAWCESLNSCINTEIEACPDEKGDEGVLMALDAAEIYLMQTATLRNEKAEGLRPLSILKAGCEGCYSISFTYGRGDGKKSVEPEVEVVVNDWKVISFSHNYARIMEVAECAREGGEIVPTLGGAGCRLSDVRLGDVRGLEIPHACCKSTVSKPKKYISYDTELCKRLRFGCEQLEEPFYDERGCGCAEAEKTWRDQDARTHCSPYERRMSGCPDYELLSCGWLKRGCEDDLCRMQFQNPCTACIDESVLFWTYGKCPENKTKEDEKYLDITDFIQCMRADFEIIEGEPRMCETPDGRIFTEYTCESEGGKKITAGSRSGIIKICMWTDIDSYCFMDEIENGECAKSDKRYVCDHVDTHDEGFYDAKTERLLFWAKCATQQGDDIILGGFRDEYGCIQSAGYMWCEPKKRCIRPWEEVC